MRTTIDIDPSLLAFARGVAARSKESIGSIISRLALKGLESNRASIESTRNGFPIFSRSEAPETMTLETVQELMADEDLPA
ncbi:MAG: hypothetical protein ACFHW5_10790 [Verrucomicrobiota bacterium]|jgi:hypothetical protein